MLLAVCYPLLQYHKSNAKFQEILWKNLWKYCKYCWISFVNFDPALFQWNLSDITLWLPIESQLFWFDSYPGVNFTNILKAPLRQYSVPIQSLTFTASTKNLREKLSYKNPHVKCRWNWSQESFSFHISLYKVLLQRVNLENFQL
jgi:hypothetical protein